MFKKISYLLAIAALAGACRKEDGPPPVPTGPVTQQEVNNWILDSMRYFYLWNDHLPAKADTQPAAVAYFNQLKYTLDHFSIIYNPADATTYPKYMLYTYGMDFSIISWPGAPGGAMGVIKQVIRGSHAEQAGLKRGDYFTRVNGTAVSSSNAGTLGQDILRQPSATFTQATVSNGAITEGSPLTLGAGNWGENPIYNPTVLTIGSKKAGYLFYNYFNDSYNTALINVFQDFRNAGVTELILDLRYNPGGSVTAAALLTALIAPNINEQSMFARYSGNNHLGQRNISFAAALSVPERGAPVAFSTLSPARLSLQRVFILSGPQTTSAAELTINNLKPYTSVVQIGQTTYGKDKGAVIISDTRTPQRIPWTLLPITYYLYNANWEGNYAQGIAPKYTIDEMSTQPLLPIGNTGDPLIARAISLISGNGRAAEETTPRIVQRFYDAGKQAAEGNIVVLPR